MATMNTYFIYLLASLLLLAFAIPASAQWPDDRRDDQRKGPGPYPPGMGRSKGPGQPPPFGAYCPQRHADQYGARQPVLTIEDARGRLIRYFDIAPERIRRLEERRHVFLAEITDQEGRPVELVIIDRRTGRIRSIR